MYLFDAIKKAFEDLYCSVAVMIQIIIHTLDISRACLVSFVAYICKTSNCVYSAAETLLYHCSILYMKAIFSFGF